MLKILILLLLPQIVFANMWQDLWLNKDQQGAKLLKQNKNKEAAQVFKDRNWKGIAYYRDGKYQEAYNEFKGDNSAQGLYNQGNALAHLQKYEEAIQAYNKSLGLQKNFPDTLYNKELVEKLLQQQQKQKDNQKQSDKNKSKQKQEKQQNDSKQNSGQNPDNKQSGQKPDNQKSQGQQPGQNDAKDKQADKDKSEAKQNNGQNPDNKQQQNNQSGQNKSAQDKSNQGNTNNGQTSQKTDSNDKSQHGQAGSEPDNKNPKPDTAKDQAANSGNPENRLKDPIKKPQAPAPIQGNIQPQTDKNPDGAAPTTNYMRPQTPTDIEVKSALSRVPDDPGGLLRNKFLRDYQRQGGNNE
jgi:Ca-activated chloride channel family protein